MVLQVRPAQQNPTITWEALPADYVLPDDPVENIQQPALAAALTDALGAAGFVQPHMLIGGNFGLVATVNKKIVVKAPDWFYVPRVNAVAPGVIRRSYTPNLEGNSVAVVMEFLSDTEGGELSIRATPPYGKFYFYEQILRVPTYITYDPYALSLEVRCLQEGRYSLQAANQAGRWWIPELSLFLGLWSGERLGQTTANTNWLRWWDGDGNLLLWSSEQAQQERQRAEQAQQQAEQERQRTEQAQQQAEQERQRAEALAARLRELGIDPEGG